MASLPSPALNGPPPSPMVPGPPPPGPGPGGGGPPPQAMPGVPPQQPLLPVPGGVPFDAKNTMKGIAQLGLDADRALSVLAQVAPIGSKEFNMAKQLVQAGLAKHLSSTPDAQSASPTATGNQFPGSSSMI